MYAHMHHEEGVTKKGEQCLFLKTLGRMNLSREGNQQRHVILSLTLHGAKQKQYCTENGSFLIEMSLVNYLFLVVGRTKNAAD